MSDENNLEHPTETQNIVGEIGSEQQINGHDLSAIPRAVKTYTFDSLIEEIQTLNKDNSLSDLEPIMAKAAQLNLSEAKQEELAKAVRIVGFTGIQTARRIYREAVAAHRNELRRNSDSYHHHLQLSATTKEPIGNAYNAAIVLGSLYGRDKSLFYDEFHRAVFFRGAKIRDTNIYEMLLTVQAEAIPTAKLEHLRPAIDRVARENTIHSLQDYLNGLEWDGRSRIGRWLQTYCGAENSQYLRLVGGWTLIGAVARAFKPGSKVDHMPVLIHGQGENKSKVWKVLSGNRSIEFTADFNSKDGQMQMQGKWFIDFAELTSLHGREAAEAKAFITKEIDNFRRPYGQEDEAYERSYVLCGTGNPEEFLSDVTGNRRYWIVPCGEIDIAGLEEATDQLWAEAVALYRGTGGSYVGTGGNRGGERWYPIKGVDQDWFYAEQDRVNAKYFQWDIWLGPIMRYCRGNVGDMSEFGFRKTVTSEQIAVGALTMKVEDVDRRAQVRIGKCLRILGYESGSARDGKDVGWGWIHRQESKL